MSLTRLDFTSSSAHHPHSALLSSSSATSSPSPVDPTLILSRMDDNQNSLAGTATTGLPFTLPAVSTSAAPPAYQQPSSKSIKNSDKLPPKPEQDPLQKWNLTCTSSPSFTIENPNDLQSPLRQSVPPIVPVENLQDDAPERSWSPCRPPIISLPCPVRMKSKSPVRSSLKNNNPTHRRVPTPPPSSAKSTKPAVPVGQSVVVTPEYTQAASKASGRGSCLSAQQAEALSHLEKSATITNIQQAGNTKPEISQQNNVATFRFVYGGGDGGTDDNSDDNEEETTAQEVGLASGRSTSQEIIVLKKPCGAAGGNSSYTLLKQLVTQQDVVPIAPPPEEDSLASDAEEFHSVINTEDEYEEDEETSESFDNNNQHPTDILIDTLKDYSSHGIIQPDSHSAFSSASSSGNSSPSVADSTTTAYEVELSTSTGKNMEREEDDHELLEDPPADTPTPSISISSNNSSSVKNAILTLVGSATRICSSTNESLVISGSPFDSGDRLFMDMDTKSPTSLEIPEDETTPVPTPEEKDVPIEVPVDLSTPTPEPILQVPVQVQIEVQPCPPTPEAPESFSAELEQPPTHSIPLKRPSTPKTCRFREEVTQLLSPAQSTSLTNIYYCNNNNQNLQSEGCLDIHRSSSDSVISVIQKGSSGSDNANSTNGNQSGVLNSSPAQAALVIIGTGSETDDERDSTTDDNGLPLNMCFPAHEVKSSRTLIRRKFYKKRKDKLVRLINTAEESIAIVETTGTQVSTQLEPISVGVEPPLPELTQKVSKEALSEVVQKTEEPQPEPEAVGISSPPPEDSPEPPKTRPKSATDSRSEALPQKAGRRKRAPRSAVVPAPTFTPDSGEGGDTTTKPQPKAPTTTKKLRNAPPTAPLPTTTTTDPISATVEVVDQLVSALVRIKNIQHERDRYFTTNLPAPTPSPPAPLAPRATKKQSAKKAFTRPSTYHSYSGEEQTSSSSAAASSSSPKSPRKPWTSSCPDPHAYKPAHTTPASLRPWSSPHQVYLTPQTTPQRPSTPTKTSTATPKKGVSRKSSATSTTSTIKRTIKASIIYDSPHSTKPGIRYQTIERLATPKVLAIPERHTCCLGGPKCAWKTPPGSAQQQSQRSPKLPATERYNKSSSEKRTTKSKAPSKTSVCTTSSQTQTRPRRSGSAKKKAKIVDGVPINPSNTEESIHVLVKRNLSACTSAHEGHHEISAEHSITLTSQGTQTKRKSSKLIKVKRAQRGILKKSKEESTSYSSAGATKCVTLCESQTRSNSTKSVRILHPPYCRYREDQDQDNSASEESCGSQDPRLTLQSPKQLFNLEFDAEEKEASEPETSSLPLSYSKRRFRIPKNFGEIAMSSLDSEDVEKEEEPPLTLDEVTDEDVPGLVQHSSQNQVSTGLLEVEGMTGFANVTMLIPNDAELVGKQYVDLNIIVRRRNAEGSLPQMNSLKGSITRRNIYVIMDEHKPEVTNDSVNNNNDEIKPSSKNNATKLAQFLCPQPNGPSKRSHPFSMYYGGKIRLAGGDNVPANNNSPADKIDTSKMIKPQHQTGHVGDGELANAQRL